MKTFNEELVMKKIIFILFAILILSCCYNANNNGYSYYTSSSQSTNKSSFNRVLERANERVNRKTMHLYDTNGLMVSSCAVYKGEFDGHSWYVFYGNLSSPSVVHDPLCNCTKK